MSLGKSLQRRTLAALMRLPGGALDVIGGGRHTKDGIRLDPHFNAIAKLYGLIPRPKLEELPPAKARREYKRSIETLSEPKPSLHRVDDIEIEGVPCRLYCPIAAPKNLPLLVYYHGGGGVVGDPDTCDSPCRQLALHTECLIISVDYRMGPEHHFPAALDDALAVFRSAQRHADRYGADAARIAVAGDSFGACLAALVSLRTAAAGEPVPVHQLLIYPVTDFGRSGGSRDQFEDGYLLNGELIRWFRQNCFGVPIEDVPRDASPLLHDIPARTPPATVHIAGFDPLRDEGKDYAQHLQKAGVEVEQHCFEGMVHGYFSFTGVCPAAADALNAAGTALKRAFSR